MKPASKRLAAVFVLTALCAVAPLRLFASQAPAAVASGDPTYGMLSQLESAGLLPAGSAAAPLTRVQVADRIFEARQKYREIVLAQVDSNLLPSIDDIDQGASASSTAAPAVAAPNPSDLAKAASNLTSLEDAYKFELKSVQDSRQEVEDNSKSVEAGQYDLWKRLKGIEEYPTISIHGLGRAFGISDQYYGNSGLSLNPASKRFGSGYLDLEPTGVISKQVSFDVLMRLATDFESNSTANTIDFPKISAHFNPDFMSLDLGDYQESYTALTLWNRDNLDLKYKPEMWERQDDQYKYTSFFNERALLAVQGRPGGNGDWMA